MDVQRIRWLTLLHLKLLLLISCFVLSGEIPAELGLLPELRCLWLKYNKLTGEGWNVLIG